MPAAAESPASFIESPIAAALLSVPAFLAWGIVGMKGVDLPLGEGSGLEDRLALGFAATAIACAIGAGIYALRAAVKNSATAKSFGIGVLCAGIAMLASTVLSIFRWRSESSSDLLVALGSCVPPLAYSIAFLASRSLRGRSAATGKEGFIPAAIAALWLVAGGAVLSGRLIAGLVQSALPLFIGFFLASLLAFSFFAARLAYSRISRGRRLSSPAARALFSLVLPLAGIGVSALSRRASLFDGYFDFLLSPAFIVLIILSGLSLCVPDQDRTLPRLIQACARSALFCASAYVALVFLPLAPAIPFASFFFGAGLLLALPTLNLICHFSAIRSDFAFLQARLRPILLASALVPSFLMLPAFLAGRAFLDAANLKAAISWARGERLEESQISINTEALTRSLAEVAPTGMRAPGRGFPILSELRVAIATGGERLGARTYDLLGSAFLGLEASRDWNRSEVIADSSGFAPKACLESSSFDRELGLRRSRIELNPRYEGRDRLGEFRITFKLPRAAWLRDYYLYVGSEKRPGLLYERRAASSIYESKLRAARDPGLLVISENNEATLRVFPFAPGEERRTGFEILHAEAFTLDIGGASIDLPGIGDEEAGFAAEWILPPSRLASLPAALRQPYLHVIVDASAAALAEREALSKSVEAALRIPLPRSGALPARISFVDYEERSRTGEDDWELMLESLAGRGGFLPYRAIRRLALEAEREDPESFPVFVVARAAPALEWAPKSAEEPLNAAVELAPETEGVYTIGPDGRLALIGPSGAEATSGPLFQPAARIESGGAERVVRTREAHFGVGKEARGPLAELVRIQAESKSTQPIDKDRMARLIAASKESGVLCPRTAFLVLERDPDYEAVARTEKAGTKGIGDDPLVELGLSPLWLAAALTAGAAAYRALGTRRGAARSRRRTRARSYFAFSTR